MSKDQLNSKVSNIEVTFNVLISALSEGYLPEVVANLQRESTEELRDLRVRIYSRWSFAWAVKR